MSTSKMGQKWADVDEEEEDPIALGASLGTAASRFESKADEAGFKSIVEYSERDGRTYKITRKVKVTKITTRTNAAIQARKDMKKFGLALTNDAKTEAQLIVRSEENVNIEFTKKPAMQLATKDDVEEKFYEESLAVTEALFKEKKAWTASRPTADTEPVGVTAPADADKKPEGTAAAADAPAAGGQQGKYLPPSLRNQQGGKGGGKDSGGQQPGQEASLRITNLSEDVKEGDLQDLFGQCGRLQRVFLAKDPSTMQSKGFAFITYYNREDAQKAINKLNGHGYDNLILQVQWAKPRG